ncbi:MAG: pesticin C-terminus-like muramidase [Paracoccaceae bacterium]
MNYTPNGYMCLAPWAQQPPSFLDFLEKLNQCFSPEPVGQCTACCPLQAKSPLAGPIHEHKPSSLDETLDQNEETLSKIDYFSVPRGQLTFDAEGNDTAGSDYYSRKPHVPPVGSSGVTIGRGYDMGQRSNGQQIVEDLVSAGVPPSDAEKFRHAAGLKRADAEAFLQENNLEDFELTPQQQFNLFSEVYLEHEAELKDMYGDEWDPIDQSIKDVLIDMKFRGDFTKADNRHTYEAVKANDLNGYLHGLETMNDKGGIPADRARRREEHIKNALDRLEK